MKHATIFVVNDESDSLDVLIHTLQSAGFKTLVESRGQQVRQQLERTQPELLLIEVHMPAKDGTAIAGPLSDTGDELTHTGIREALEEFEKQYIVRILEHNHGHRKKTANMLGLPLRTFQRKLKKLGLI